MNMTHLIFSKMKFKAQVTYKNFKLYHHVISKWNKQSHRYLTGQPWWCASAVSVVVALKTEHVGTS